MYFFFQLEKEKYLRQHYFYKKQEYLIQYNQQKGGVFEEDLKKEADNSEKDREKHNEQLFGLVFGYWILTILGILFIFIFRKVVTHYLNRDNQNIPPFNREISIHDIKLCIVPQRR